MYVALVAMWLTPPQRDALPVDVDENVNPVRDEIDPRFSRAFGREGGRMGAPRLAPMARGWGGGMITGRR